MIVDAIKNAELYYSLSPRIKQAFDWLAQTDVEALTTGRHDIDGDNLFVNVMDVDLKPRHEAALEVHDRYIDIQIMVGAEEEYGWSERCDCHSPREEFNREKDVQFFTDVPQTFFSLNERQFAIFFPEDAHAPMLGEGKVRKLIFKLLIN
jgi:YhcH/YjgK/YiaL family protein